MRANSERLEYVQQRVSRGEYRVSSERVAAAMLERIGATVSERESVSDRESGHALLRALSGLRAV